MKKTLVEAKVTQMEKLIVIGGGPAGVTAALRARELGAAVTLIEGGALGGVCTNDGCVPTRVLARAARLARNARQFADYGLTPVTPQVDFRRLLDKAQEVVYTVHEKKQLQSHLAGAGVQVYADSGPAHFVDPHTVELGDGTQLTADKFILCAGGRARKLPIPGAEYTLTHSDVWSMKALPAAVAIIGAAATGCQLASVFNTFGAEVHLLDLAPRILPGEDTATSAQIAAAFNRRGLHVHAGIDGVKGIERTGAGMRLTFVDNGAEQSVEVDTVIQAVGWPGNADRLNLEAAGVTSARSYVVVDDYLRTTAPHIFAAGDINGRMMLVQSAGHEARIAAENAVLGPTRAAGHQIVPHGGFTDPEYASVGLTEDAARRDHDIVVAEVSYADLDRAVIDGRTEGLCKLVANRADGTLLGAHVVGEQALEIVHMVAAGMVSGMTALKIAQMEIAYPTYTAVLGLAARRLLTELGSDESSAHWRGLGRTSAPVSEWERREPLA
jgi:pyruvate/2-oxoglutarate dehydrogenase complex dihydrolipoamide dehydrogenase (E3) component